jgi:hypothetical protein
MIVSACLAKTPVQADVKGRRITGLTVPTPEKLTFYEAPGVTKPQYRDVNAV